MSRRFLDLCKSVVRDLGVAGGTLNSVTGQLNQEQLRIIDWVARADLYIQNLWVDWKFLWYADDSVLVQAGTDVLTPTLPPWADNLQTVEEGSLWLAAGTATARRIGFMEWDQFRELFQRKLKSTQAVPVAWSRDPAGRMLLSHKTQATLTFSLDYHCIGKRMAGNDDTSPVPNNFDQLICEKAKMYYAERENAPEIMSGAVAEYTDSLEKMEAVCLPGNTAGRRSRNDEHSIPRAYTE